VTLLVGDVSFMHDSNALLLLRDQHSIPPLCIVVVNNQGGGIFNFLPVAQARPSALKKKKKNACVELPRSPPTVEARLVGRRCQSVCPYTGDAPCFRFASGQRCAERAPGRGWRVRIDSCG
jgi:hypothetical protein